MNSKSVVRFMVHPSWKGHHNEKEVRELIRKLSPESLSALLLKDDDPDDATIKLLELECKAAGIPLETVNYFWFKTEEDGRGYSFSINAKNPQPTREEIYKRFNQIIEDSAPTRFKTPRAVKANHRSTPNPLAHPHLFFLPLTDLHIDKFHDPPQNQYERIFEGVKGILQKTAGYNIEKFVIWISSDCLNSEGSSRRTTNGTEQVNSMPWYEAYPYAFNFYIVSIAVRFF